MPNIHSKLSKILSYNQKKDWDILAYSYIKESVSILDAGCGIGRFLKINPKKITGLERNTVNLNSSKKKGYKVIQGDVTSLPFNDATFDAIHCSHVIEHLTPSELHKTLQEFDRTLKVNGKLIIIAPLLWKFFYSDLTHIKPYNPDAILHYMEGGVQRTKNVISDQYELVNIHWRHTPLTMRSLDRYNKSKLHRIKMSLLQVLDWLVYKLHLGKFLHKNGYMLILQKCKK